MSDLDLVDTTEAMCILDEYRTAVIRMVHNGLLPYVVKGERGRATYQFDRAVVENLATKRTEAREVLGLKRRQSKERDQLPTGRTA